MPNAALKAKKTKKPNCCNFFQWRRMPMSSLVMATCTTMPYRLQPQINRMTHLCLWPFKTQRKMPFHSRYMGDFPVVIPDFYFGLQRYRAPAIFYFLTTRTLATAADRVYLVCRTVSGCCCRQYSGVRFCWSPWSRLRCGQTRKTASPSRSSPTH